MSDTNRAGQERRWRDAASRGDAAAWRSLLESAWEAVTTFIRWRTGETCDLADEVIQETWLLAARKVARFDPDTGPFAGWVCGLAANVIRNQLRSRRRREARLLSWAEFRASPSVQPDSDEKVALALSELPAPYELALRLKYLEGLSVDEIANRTGQTTKAVESQLTRARDDFRRHYES